MSVKSVCDMNYYSLVFAHFSAVIAISDKWVSTFALRFVYVTLNLNRALLSKRKAGANAPTRNQMSSPVHVSQSRSQHNLTIIMANLSYPQSNFDLDTESQYCRQPVMFGMVQYPEVGAARRFLNIVFF